MRSAIKHFRSRWLKRWAIPVLPFVIVLLAIACWLAAPNPGHITGISVSFSLITLSAVGLGILQFWQQKHLARLHHNILNAREGILEPLNSSLSCHGPLKDILRDYNEMMTILRAMFTTVEECQNRILDERNRISALLQSLPGALLNVDDNLVIHSVYRQAVELLGMEADQLVGSNLFDVLNLDKFYRELLRDVFLYKRTLSNQEIRVDINGREHWLSFNLAFLNEHEADMGAVIIIQDITDYKHLQETIWQREKFVAMGQVAAGVAHELNTPLGNILGYTQLLSAKGDDPQRRAHYETIIRDEAQRCSRIVSDLLNFARRDKCEGDACDINQVIEDVVDSFISCRLRRIHVGLELDLTPGELFIDGSCGELEIVLTNLLWNAIQALGGTENGRIVVTTNPSTNGVVYLSVSDNGPGIPRELRQRIFEPFFTTKDVGAGSGLGLAISQAMLEKRGASIMLDTNWSPGARFVIQLPAVTVDTYPAAEACLG